MAVWFDNFAHVEIHYYLTRIEPVYFIYDNFDIYIWDCADETSIKKKYTAIVS